MRRLIRFSVVIVILLALIILNACNAAPPASTSGSTQTTAASPTSAPAPTQNIPKATVPPLEAKLIDLEFVDDVTGGIPMQDVFIEDDALPADQVRRFEASDVEAPTVRTKILYTSAVPTEPDLFMLGPAPLGPFPKGHDFGLTVEQWMAAKGTGTYTVQGDTGEIDVSFQNLIPNGVYTLWCSRITLPPNYKMLEEPCGAPDGSQNDVIVDAQGSGALRLKLPALPDTDATIETYLCLAYHSDGKTHGYSVGEFGLNAHTHLCALIPPPDDATWRTVAKPAGQ